MSETAGLDTGLCHNCLTDGAERCMIVGLRLPGEEGWAVIAAELCEPCKDIAIALSRKPGALTTPPWELPPS